MNTLSKTLLVAASGLVVSAGVALARPAVVETDLNMRARAGTHAPVVVVLPRGVRVEIHECRGGWCAVSWRGYDGYASARYLAPLRYGPRYRRPPPYYGGGYYYGPDFGVTIRLGDDDRRRRKGRRHRDRDHDGDRGRRRSSRDGKSRGGLNDFKPINRSRRDN